MLSVGAERTRCQDFRRQDGVCLVELEDNSTITVSMATWNQIVQCGLEACGYTQGQKVKCVVAGQPGDREEEKRWEQL